MSIDPSARVDPSADVDDSNHIGPNVTIEAGVRLGKRNRILANAFICSGTTIGDDNQIHMNAVIGHVPQDTEFSGEPSFTELGDRNTVREFATIHRGTASGSVTRIGDDCFIMALAHVAHNCSLGNRVTLANLCSVAGHVVVGDGAFLSGNTVIHQFCRIGALSMLGGLSAVNRDLPPYMLARGRPAAVAGVNAVGLRRSDVTPAARRSIKNAYRTIYRSGLILPEALARLDQDEVAEVRQLVRFIRESRRGIMIGAEGGGARDGAG